MRLQFKLYKHLFLPFFFVVAGFLFLVFPSNVEASYSYYRTITVDDAKVPNTDQAAFPVLVCANGTAPCDVSVAGLNQSGAGAHVTDAEGDDIGVFTTSACTTKVTAWEVEKYTASTGELIAWVNAGTLKHDTTGDTVFYMCYGDSSVTTFQSTASSVWDTNYKGVWHLPNGTTLTANESTSNPNDCTISEAVAVSSQIDGGANFDGVDDLLDCGSGSSLDNLKAGGGVTISAWINPNTMGEGNEGIIVSKVGIVGWTWRFLSGTTNALRFAHTGGTLLVRTMANSLITLDVWQYILMTWDGSNTAANVHIYLNGSEVTYQTTTNGATLDTDANDPFMIGAQGAGLRDWNGGIDEARVSNIIRSADWITTEYNNQSSPSTFYAVGAETEATNPTVSTLSPADNATGVSPTANLVITFDEAVNQETGNILIKQTSDDSTVETIDVAGALVTGDGTATITVNPSVTLTDSTEYYVQIATTAFDDTSGNSYAGITDTTSWSFTTGDTTNPTVSTLSPADNATGVSPTANLVITFDEAVNQETGNILIKQTSDDSTVETIDVAGAL